MAALHSSLFYVISIHINSLVPPRNNSITPLFVQGASMNRAILQHCFFLVRQHCGACRYRQFIANFKAF